MKVALFSGNIPYAVCLANALAPFCEVDMFYGTASADKCDREVLAVLSPKIRQVVVTPYRLRDPRNCLSYLRLAKRLREYDIVHTQLESIWHSLMRYLPMRHPPLVYTVHDPYLHPGLKLAHAFYQGFSQRLMIRQASAYVVHGKRLKPLLAQHYNIPTDKIEVIAHGEFSFYKTIREPTPAFAEKDRDCPTILFMGAIRKNKGLEYLIRAEPLIAQECPDFKICVAGKFDGDYDYYEKLMTRRDRYEIIDEYVPSRKIAGIIDSCDIMTVPYSSGTQSGIVILSQSFGKPVVATRVGSIDEIITDGENGLLVPPADEKALAKAIIRLIKDDKLRKRLAKGAEQTAHTKLRWIESGRQHIALYKKVIGDK